MANASGQSRIHREITRGPSGGATMTFASGARLAFDAGASMTFQGVADFTSGRITFPPNLARGYIELVPKGVKTTATASGLITAWTTGVNPAYVNPDITSGYAGYRWSTAAGAQNPLHFGNVRVPGDLATGGGLSVHVVATGAVANATNAINVLMRAGTATAAINTTHVLGAAPAETTAVIASGSVPATGFWSFSAFPENAHASGNITLYGVGLSYTKRTS